MANFFLGQYGLWALGWAWQTFFGLWALGWAWQTFFLGQSIGIDKNNIFQLKFPQFWAVCGR